MILKGQSSHDSIALPEKLLQEGIIRKEGSGLPPPAAHFATGAGIAFYAGMLLLPSKRTRKALIYWPFVMTACGLWALVPDISELYAAYPSLPFYKFFTSPELKAFLHQKQFDLVFFFHPTMDRLWDKGESLGFTITILLYNVVFLLYVIYIRGLKKARADEKTPNQNPKDQNSKKR